MELYCYHRKPYLAVSVPHDVLDIISSRPGKEEHFYTSSISDDDWKNADCADAVLAQK